MCGFIGSKDPLVSSSIANFVFFAMERNKNMTAAPQMVFRAFESLFPLVKHALLDTRAETIMRSQTVLGDLLSLTDASLDVRPDGYPTPFI